MIKRALLAIGLIATTSAAIAQTCQCGTKPIHEFKTGDTLTAADMNKNEKRAELTLKSLLHANQRIQALEADLANTKKNFVRDTNTLYAQGKELERKVAGMQKQITILHAKKANKQ